MFIPILKYELRYWLRSPLSYLFIATVFGIALIMTLGTAGYFDAPRAAAAHANVQGALWTHGNIGRCETELTDARHERNRLGDIRAAVRLHGQREDSCQDLRRK